MLRTLPALARAVVRQGRQGRPWRVVSALPPRSRPALRLPRPATAATAAVTALRHALLPKGYPSSVVASYAAYAWWQAGAGVVGSASGVVATQALLAAAGLGAGALPLAAGINWVLKDGIGQVGWLWV